MTSVMIDAGIVAVLALSMYFGWRTGLFRTLMGLLVLIVALVVSLRASALAAGAVIERVLRPSTMAAMEEQVDRIVEEGATLTRQEEMERLVATIPNGLVRSQAEKLLDRLRLSDQAEQGREALLEAGTELVDTVLDSLVRGILQAVICAALFTVLLLALRLAVRAADIVFDLPLLRQLNEVGGVLLGALRGAAVVWLGVWFIRQLGLVDSEVLAQSWILRYFPL